MSIHYSMLIRNAINYFTIPLLQRLFDIMTQDNIMIIENTTIADKNILGVGLS